MNPVALQLAKGRPLAPTSWGAFGPQIIQAGLVSTGGGVAQNLEATVEGESSVVGTLAETRLLEGESLGEATVQGTIAPSRMVSSLGRALIQVATLDAGISELQAEVFGDAAVSGDLFRGIEVPYKPIPYPLSYGITGVAELSATLLGFAEVKGKGEVPPGIDVRGEGEVEGDLTQSGTLDLDGASTIFGDAIATGELFVDGVLELDGESTGDAECYMLGPIASDDGTGFFVNDSFHYYIYGNILTGFNPTDHVDGSDGDIIRDFARHKYLFTNINVGFDYTDDVSHYTTFVSQDYPDGDIIRDFARYKYQYLLVIPEVTPPFKRLTIGPAPRKPRDLTPTPRPPRKKNR